MNVNYFNDSRKVADSCLVEVRPSHQSTLDRLDVDYSIHNGCRDSLDRTTLERLYVDYNIHNGCRDSLALVGDHGSVLGVYACARLKQLLQLSYAAV